MSHTNQNRIHPTHDLGPPPQKLHEHVAEAERLTGKLQDILENDRPVLERNGMDRDAEHLAYWAEKYLSAMRSGMMDDSENNSAWLAGVIDRMQMEAYEMESLHTRGVINDGQGPHPHTNDFISSARAVSKTVYDAKALYVRS